MRDLFKIVIGMALMAAFYVGGMNAGLNDEWNEKTVEIEYDNHKFCDDFGFCLEVHNVYHEDIIPFEFLGLDSRRKIINIKVDPMFTQGNDGACQAFGVLVNNVLEELPEGWAIYVVNSWVPSKYNPIDLEWSRKLAEGY